MQLQGWLQADESALQGSCDVHYIVQFITCMACQRQAQHLVLCRVSYTLRT